MEEFEYQFKNYPAIISLFKEVKEKNRKNSKRYAYCIINEYNYDLKQFIGTIHYKLIGNMNTDLIVRILKHLRAEYIKRVDTSLKLNKIEKSWLRNYLVARCREEINTFIGQKSNKLR